MRIGLAAGPQALGIHEIGTATLTSWSTALETLGATVVALDLGTTAGLRDLWTCHGLIMLSDGAYHEAGHALTLSVITEWCRAGGALAAVGASPFLLAADRTGLRPQIRAAIDIIGLAVGFNASEVDVLVTPDGARLVADATVPTTLTELNLGADRLLTLHGIPDPEELALVSSAGDPILAAHAIGDGWLVSWSAAVQPPVEPLIRDATLGLLLPRLASRAPRQPDIVFDRSAGEHGTVLALLARPDDTPLTLVDADTGDALGRTLATDFIATFEITPLVQPRSLTVREPDRSERGAAVVCPSPRPPHPIGSRAVPPSDFDAFWELELARLAGVPANPRATPCPELSTDTVRVSRVAFTSADFVTVSGLLSMPVRASADAAPILSLPGYSVSGLESHPWTLAERCGVLSIDVRRVGSPLGELPMAAEGILTHRLDTPHRFGMRGAVLDSVRAVDVLGQLTESSRPPAIIGASQGGALAIAVGALRDDTAAVAASVPFLVNIDTAFESVDSEPYAELRRHLARFPERREQALRTLAYVDAAHFLRRLHVPTLIVAAPDDDIAPIAGLVELVSELPGVELRLCEGGHMGAALRTVRREVDAWVTEHLAARTRPSRVRDPRR